MSIAQQATRELGELVRKNFIEYEANADTLKKNFRRTVIGLGAYYLVSWAGPDSNTLTAAMTFVAEKSLLIYTITRGYQTFRDMIKYL